MEFAHRGAASAAGFADWERDGVDVVEGRLERTAEPVPSYRDPRVVLRDRDVRGTPIDVAVDPCGTPFVLTDAAELYRVLPQCGRTVRLRCSVADQVRSVAVGVDRSTIYVADEDGTVRAYARDAAGMRWEHQLARPVAMVRHGSDVYVLDRGDRGGEGVLYRVTPAGQLSPVVLDLDRPRDVAIDADGAIYVLSAHSWDEPTTPVEMLVRKIPTQAVANAPTTASGTVFIPPAGCRLDGAPFHLTSIAAGTAGELVGGGEDGVGSFRSREASFRHMFDLDRPATAMTIGANALYVLDTAGVLRAVDGTTERVRDRTDEHRGHARVRLDAGTPGTTWHRIHLDRELPADTAMGLRYVAGDALPERLAPTPSSTDLTTVPGIGHRKAWRLRRAGIDTIDALAESDPTTVAAVVSVEEIDVPIATVDTWIEQAHDLLDDGETRLQRVAGIGRRFARALTDAGIETLADLVATDPALVSTIVGGRLRTVSTDRTAAWIEAADAMRSTPPDPEALAWRSVPPDPDVVLLEAATGRYLWIELDLVGSATATPTIEAVDVTYPRRTYLEDLPAVYRSDQDTAAFLTRYLSLFEHVLSDVGEETADLVRHLDAAGVAPAYVSWLGEWIAADGPDGWPTAARRAFLERAPELHERRGTRAGLQAAIDCYLEHITVDTTGWSGPDGEPPQLIRVVEYDDLAACRDTPDWATYERIVGCPTGFAVLIHPAVADRHVEAIGRIVGHQRPAHADGRAVALRPHVVLAGDEPTRTTEQTYLGVNSQLAPGTFALEDSRLGRETRLGERETHASVGIRSRLDEDSRLA